MSSLNRRNITRRTILKSALLSAALPSAALIPTAYGAAALVPLDPKDVTAKALGYNADSAKVDAKTNPTHKVEQKCSTCVQFVGKPGEARAGCNLFPGKSVAAAGWCKVWALKPVAPAAKPAVTTTPKPVK